MENQSRRIQLVGNRSYAISLPKKWVLENNLSEKMEVNIHQNYNSLVLTPQNQKNPNIDKKKVLIDDVNLVSSIVILAYQKGIKELTLQFKNSDEYYKSKISLNKLLTHIDSFKIVEEQNNSITISSFYHSTKIDLKKISKRMTLIINQMVECVKNGENQIKQILENECDSLFYLSNRILFKCSQDLEIRSENNILDIEEIFHWRSIFKRLENIADLINKSIYIKDESEIVLEIIEYLNDIFLYQKTVKMENIDKLKSINVSKKKQSVKIIKLLSIDILQDRLIIDLNKKYF